MELEPVREDTKEEEKDGETEQHQGTHDAGSEEDLSSLRRNQVVGREDDASLLAQVDQGQSRESRGTACDKRAVGLVAVHEPGGHDTEDVDGQVEEGHEEPETCAGGLLHNFASAKTRLTLEHVTDKQNTDAPWVRDWDDLEGIEGHDTDEHHGEDLKTV